ncbi:serine protease [Pseudonocardiaceae bacterium YIM PH 21723]|nr:serine protease [Pseudonocardiaceae bacterium YIM PH 21723]
MARPQIDQDNRRRIRTPGARLGLQVPHRHGQRTEPATAPTGRLTCTVLVSCWVKDPHKVIYQVKPLPCAECGFQGSQRLELRVDQGRPVRHATQSHDVVVHYGRPQWKTTEYRTNPSPSSPNGRTGVPPPDTQAGKSGPEPFSPSKAIFRQPPDSARKPPAHDQTAWSGCPGRPDDRLRPRHLPTGEVMRHPARCLTLLLCALLSLSTATTAHAVIGGKRATAGQFPWIADVGNCTGSVLARYVILTAAHCVTVPGQTSGSAWTGGINLHEGQANTKVWAIPNPGGMDAGDWALIEVRDPITAAPLKIADQGDTSLHTGKLTLAGFGETDALLPVPLMYAELPFVPDATCRTQHPDTELCAGGANGNPGACYGDSGGPLAAKNAAGEWVQVGVVHGGDACASYTYFAEVQAASDKIKAYLTPEGRLKH